jgi:hypothetical protein
MQPPLTEADGQPQPAPAQEAGPPSPGPEAALPLPAAPPAASPAVPERRATFRRKRLLRVRISDPCVLFEPYLGWVVDRSLGGFGLLVDQAIEEGRILRLRATDAPQHIPWVEVHVNRCQEKDGTWEVGCEFVHTPSWEAMLTFG